MRSHHTIIWLILSVLVLRSQSRALPIYVCCHKVVVKISSSIPRQRSHTIEIWLNEGSPRYTIYCSFDSLLLWFHLLKRKPSVFGPQLSSSTGLSTSAEYPLSHLTALHYYLGKASISPGHVTPAQRHSAVAAPSATARCPHAVEMENWT